MKRPVLNEIPLDTVMVVLLSRKSSTNVTMSIGQWDRFLQAAYDAGHNLIELDKNEIPVRAYKKRLE